MTKTKSRVAGIAPRTGATAGSRVATVGTDPQARDTAEAGAGLRNGSDRNKSKEWLGTMGRTREKAGREAASSSGGRAAGRRRANEAAADRAARTARDGSTTRWVGTAVCSSL